MFFDFRFANLKTGVLVGYLTDGSSRGFYYKSKQAFAVSLPEPYYFQMGYPILYRSVASKTDTTTTLETAN